LTTGIKNIPLKIWRKLPGGALARAHGIWRRLPGGLKGKLRASLLNAPINAFTSEHYPAWFEENRTKRDELDKQREYVFAYRPLFSIIVPLYKTPLPYLHQMLNSVLAQTYGHLELILVNASPEIAELKDELVRIAADDLRIQVVTLKSNLGIALNTNAGIAVAQGDFVCFLDHDDFLEPDTLFHYAEALETNPEIDLLYCDEHLVDESGVPLHPLFKPDYSPEYLLSKNYVIHLLTIRKSLLDKLEPASPRHDGAQDYHITFAAAEQARSIHHVQKVLYHWRISAHSTAVKADAKPYAEEAGRLCIEEHLMRTGQGGSAATSAIKNVYWAKPSIANRPLVSAIIDSYDADQTSRLISVLKNKAEYQGIEIIVVPHNTLTDAELLDCPVDSALSKPDDTRSERFNQAAKNAQGVYLLFLSDELSLIQGSIADLLATCQREDVGAVAAKTLYCDGNVKHWGYALPAGGIIPLCHGVSDADPGYLSCMLCSQNFSALPLVGTMVKRAAFDAVGGFDERYRSLVGDIEFCLRLKDAGYRLVQLPGVKFEVAQSCPEPRFLSTLDPREFDQAEIQMLKEARPQHWKQSDPYYNVNFDQSSGYYQI
jgi:GT2 family glycosyltransferase